MPNTDLTKNFGGFQVINGSADGFNLSGLTDKTVIYFVRTSANKEDGYIYFNGKKYGTGKFSSKPIQDELTALKKTVDDHIANKAAVTATLRTTETDNGNLTVDSTEKWLSGDAITKIKAYVDSEDVKQLNWTEDHNLQLLNGNGVVISQIDGQDFVTDGMLTSVDLITDKTNGKVLQFTWNTDNGDKVIPIEVSEFFSEITGDTKTIQVTPASKNSADLLKISAITIADVSGVTSSATALMTGGITQKYVEQEITSMRNALTNTLDLSSVDNGVTYATANIVQENGILHEAGSGLQVNVATGLTKEHAGFLYDNTAHTFTAKETAFTKTGLLDAQEVITLLRHNNTNVKGALDYLKSQITTLSGKIPTVTGSTYITVTTGTTAHDYIVSASKALTDAITHANNAVQSVNGKSGTGVTINSSEIKLGKAVSGYTTTDSVTTVLEDIYSKLSTTSSNALTSVSGSTSITVSAKASGSQTISVKAKPLSDTEKAAGQIEIITTGTTGIYGLLYFGGDDFEA